MSARKGGYQRKHRPAVSNAKINNPLRHLPGKAARKNTGPHKSAYRDNATIKRLAMYKAKPVRNKKGRIVSGPYMSAVPDERVKRVQPDRRWFGNTRVVAQKDLEKFRGEMEEHVNDPYTVVLRTKQVPMGLLSNPYEEAKMNVLGVQSFESTFGKRATRKRPRGVQSEFNDLDSLMEHVQQTSDSFEVRRESQAEAAAVAADAGPYGDTREKIFEKGQSRRIWAELYKVIDAADVVVQVLDVRDPMGTRSSRIESELRRPERRHKHLLLVLNKVDLVPTWVTRRWVKVLSREYPTIAFHAGTSNSFGKGALIQLLRQLAALHGDRKQISVGLVGYPNVGKSSVINTLCGKKVCQAAPVPGETRVWQYVTLFRRIYLIDSPGVVYATTGNTETDSVLKGVVRLENIDEPAVYIPAVLERVKREYLCRTYGLESWVDAEDFLTQLARKSGKLLPGGEPNFTMVARRVLHDWQRGRVPFFTPPPEVEGGKAPQQDDNPQVEVDQIFDNIGVKMAFSEQDLVGPAEEQEDGEKEAPKDGANDAFAVLAASSSLAEAAAVAVEEVDEEEEEARLRAKSRRKRSKKKKKKSRARYSAMSSSSSSAANAPIKNGVVDWDAVYADVRADDDELPSPDVIRKLMADVGKEAVFAPLNELDEFQSGVPTSKKRKVAQERKPVVQQPQHDAEADEAEEEEEEEEDEDEPMLRFGGGRKPQLFNKSAAPAGNDGRRVRRRPRHKRKNRKQSKRVCQ